VSLLNKPGRQMTLEELQPLSVLTRSVKNSTQGLINRRNNRTLLGWVRNLKEMWTQVPKSGKGKKSNGFNKDHCISKMLLCKDSVTVVSQNPHIACK
uniref:Small nuclear ribonucleoprotein Sm D2 n=1 Tax=Capra hircus TaxID=9925 RepID=A0A452EVQ5_CAPHI